MQAQTTRHLVAYKLGHYRMAPPKVGRISVLSNLWAWGIQVLFKTDGGGGFFKKKMR